MKMHVRSWLLAATLLAGTVAQAQSTAAAWPKKPVTLVTAFGAGSASDIVARVLAEELKTTFKQPFVVENRPGASGMIAARQVEKAPADGYTLFLSTNTVHSVNPYLFKTLGYEPITGFTPVARVCYFPFVLAVHTSLPVRNVDELVAYGRDTSNKATYGYGNSTGQIAGAALASLTKMDAVGVSYKSSPQALTDLVGGQVSFMFADLASSRPYVKADRLRFLAVSTAQPSPQLPALPTVTQAAHLPEFDLVAWVGILAPAGVDPALVERLSREINRVLARRDIADRLRQLGADVAPGNAAELGQLMTDQLQVWGRKARDAGIRPE